MIAPITCAADAYARHVGRLGTWWRDPNGAFYTSYEDGKCCDTTSLAQDLADTVPLLHWAGLHSAATHETERAIASTRSALVCRGNVTHLFDNHDYVFGLLEMVRLTGRQSAKVAAEAALDRILDEFVVDGLTVNRRPKHYWTLDVASPFNGGFIECLVQLTELTNESRWADAAERLADAWTATPFFRRCGLAARKNIPGSPILSLACSTLRRSGPVFLVKDNVNLMWALLALFRYRPHKWLETALGHFVAGLSRFMIRDGCVRQRMLATQRFELHPAVFAVDLLCDLAFANIATDQALSTARQIADVMLRHQWECGLFPVRTGADRDHLDLMTDAGVALCKLTALTKETAYRARAEAGWRAAWAAHETENGFVLSVKRNGDIADRRVMVKYQCLLLKSAVAAAARDVYESDTWALLRDR